MTAATLMLEARDIDKRYGNTQANAGVTLRVRPGEIHALIGENGAGKSTLVNILYGIAQADRGAVFWQDEQVVIKNPTYARALGIGVVFQKFSLFEPLTVLENMMLAVAGSAAELQAAMENLAARYGLRVEGGRRVSTLSAGEKQRVEIIRCLLQKPSLLIMDEPTSVLTPLEVEQLFVLLKALAADGCAILFISHKLNEIEALCQRATVLRRGKTVAEVDMAGIGRHDLIALMLGEVLEENTEGYRWQQKATATRTPAKPLLQLQKIRHRVGDLVLQIDDLTLKGGCVLGIAGIAGNGQEPLVQCINGEIATARDCVLLGQQAIGDWSVAARVQAGILSAPTDRYHTASVGSLSLADNTLLGCVRQQYYTPYGFIHQSRLQQFADEIIQTFNVVAPNAQAAAMSLSGGNLQKFIIGRAVLQQPQVFVAANPTWGVDVQSALFIRRTLCRMADAGAAVVVVSEDLDELFEMADEIAVINNGKLSPPAPLTATLTPLVIGEQMTNG
ncbi:MAG: ATP-binding cassette domain-containing protein [Proteobacteria bacterium]|nr:ATP-binding cassette domain-containing protein [Pseudomonadota bacterium]